MTNIRNVIEGINGAALASIDTLTLVPLSGGRSNPMKDRVYKQSLNAGIMMFNNKGDTNAYRNMVERRLAAEGKDPRSFELGPRKWGTRLSGIPIVEHVKDGETKYYLEVIYMRGPTETRYLIDDGKGNLTDIEKEEIQGFKDDPEPSSTGQGGLDNKVIIRTIGLSSIQAIRADHQIHTGPFTFS